MSTAEIGNEKKIQEPGPEPDICERYGAALTKLLRMLGYGDGACPYLEISVGPHGGVELDGRSMLVLAGMTGDAK